MIPAGPSISQPEQKPCLDSEWGILTVEASFLCFEDSLWGSENSTKAAQHDARRRISDHEHYERHQRHFKSGGETSRTL